MSNALMAPRKNRRNEAGRAIAQAIVDQYKPTNVEEMQDAIKDIFGPVFEAMLQGEMDSHLGYTSNNHGAKTTNNRRNGYAHKTVKSTYGDIDVEVPRDRDASFEPQVIPKRSRDVSGIEDKVLSMYAKGMSRRDIADTIEDIYGFEISHDTISTITDRVIDTANEWQNRPLKKFYTFLFVDCLYVSIRKELETRNCAVYVILGYDVNGVKDILGVWIGESEGKHYWMQIFDEIKARGVEDVLFISMDGVLKEAQPAVKHRDSNAVMVTEPLYRSGTGKISPQYNEKETQGIRSVRDNTGRQDGMRMTAGIADMPLHSNCTTFLRLSVPFHQVPVIMPEEAQSPFRQAVWAGLVRGQGHPCCIFKPFPVRKFNFIQLEKNREPSYHKHG